MPKSTEQILTLVAAGASVEVSGKSIEQLVTIATACRAAGATMRIDSEGKSTEGLLTVLRAGGGCVTLAGL